MTMSPKASQAAAHYISVLAPEFAPEVVEEFRNAFIEMDQDRKDRTQDVFDLIENHDAVSETRTMEWYFFNAQVTAAAEEEMCQPTSEEDKGMSLAIVRLGDDLRDRIDASAKASEMSRSAWIRVQCIRALEEGR